MSESSLLHHDACPDCGSSDALGVYDDGHTYCFSCTTHTSGSTKAAVVKPRKANGLIDVTPTALPKRKLREETCRHWGYGLGEYNGVKVQVATYCDNTGTPVAQKVRFPDKSFVILGDAKRMGLYGKHLCRDVGRKIVVTEGELDALSVSQAQELRWPVVSVPNGAQSAARAVGADLEFLTGFDEVVFMFDMDEPGRAAAQACAELLPPGKGKIASFPKGYKDASDALQANDSRAILDAMWGAKSYRPDGIVDSDAMLELVRAKRGFTPIASVPFHKLQASTMGFAPGQVWVICSGSGMGKTEFCREIGFSIIKQGLKLGYVALEEGTERTALGLVGLQMNKRLHLMGNPTEEDGFMEAWDEVIRDKLYCYDHFGSMDGDNLINRMRYMIVALELRVIILDHLSIVVSGMDDGDERKTIDRIMTRIKSLAQETGACIVVVSHLKRPPGTPHEEGGQTSLGQLRGSHAIGQLANIAVGLERNQQDADNPHVTTIRILKNRETGITGPAGFAVYNTDSGRMEDYDPVFDEVDKDF